MPKTINISWAQINYDMECDGEPVMVEQEWGNKGVGGIVFGLCSVAVALPTFFTIKQILNGTATGNPIGAIVAVFVILGWPIYWGFKQFFLKRRLAIGDEVVKFEIISLLGRKKYEQKISDYEQIEYGKTKSQARSEASMARMGKYFVNLPHNDHNRKITLYQNTQKLLSEERIQRYSDKFGLPNIDITPDETHRAEEFREMAEAFVADREKR